MTTVLIQNGRMYWLNIKHDAYHSAIPNFILVLHGRLKDSTTNLHQLSRYLKDVKMLLLHKVFVTNVLGYAAYNFVIGAYSYWGPKAGYSIYHMSNADLMFGGITIFCGIFGTLGGGLILDRMNATIPNAFKLLSGATFLGAIFCFSAFCLSNLYGFLFLFAVGELFVFATQAPVNYVCLHCVKPGMRPLSMAVSTVSIHILGDVPSSPLVGILEDHINNWRITTLILTSVFFLAAGIWFIGGFLESEDMSDDTPDNAKDGMEPLLEESKAENERAETA
ncbi:Major facilitator superfamily protein [Euphorbia peplus]|nr:Major facilitator superfamily protein [Euphorbia peplus]